MLGSKSTGTSIYGSRRNKRAEEVPTCEIGENSAQQGTDQQLAGALRRIGFVVLVPGKEDRLGVRHAVVDHAGLELKPNERGERREPVEG